MKEIIFKITENKYIAKNVYRMLLEGDTSEITVPGQFVNIKLDGLFLRRPISVCDREDGLLTLIYKVVGKGTEEMSEYLPGRELDILTGLGNGYRTEMSGDKPLLLGGGAGVPPMYWLMKRLLAEGKNVTAILGFNTADEVFYEDEFRELKGNVVVVTADGSYGEKGFVTDAMAGADYSYFYACGPGPMLRAVNNMALTEGQFSFEERMGCGFGACMGCSIKTVSGAKRVCADGPVFERSEIIW